MAWDTLSRCRDGCPTISKQQWAAAIAVHSTVGRSRTPAKATASLVTVRSGYTWAAYTMFALCLVALWYGWLFAQNGSRNDLDAAAMAFVVGAVIALLLGRWK